MKKVFSSIIVALAVAIVIHSGWGMLQNWLSNEVKDSFYTGVYETADMETYLNTIYEIDCEWVNPVVMHVEATATDKESGETWGHEEALYDVADVITIIQSY